MKCVWNVKVGKDAQTPKGERILKGAGVVTKWTLWPEHRLESLSRMPRDLTCGPRIAKLPQQDSGAGFRRERGVQGEPQREEAGKGPGEGGGSLTVETSNCLYLAATWKPRGHLIKSPTPNRHSGSNPLWVFTQPCPSLPREARSAHRKAFSIAGHTKISESSAPFNETEMSRGDFYPRPWSYLWDTQKWHGTSPFLWYDSEIRTLAESLTTKLKSRVPADMPHRASLAHHSLTTILWALLDWLQLPHLYGALCEPSPGPATQE